MTETETFEDDFDRLEEIVDRLDSGRVGDGLTLDEALELYEEGVELVQRCREHLKDAEAKLDTLEEATAGADAEADTNETDTGAGV